MTNPDDEVRELRAEIERLRAELAEAQARIAWLSGDQTYQPVPGERRPTLTQVPPTYGTCPNCGRQTEDPDGGQCDECWREDDLDFGDDEEREIAR